MWKKVHTISDMLDRNVADFPDREAVVGVEYSTGAWTRHTWKELDDITRRVASFLKESGIHQGCKVAFMQGNCLENYYTYLAVHRIGGVFIPVNTRLVTREIEYIVNDSGAEYMIFGSEYFSILEQIEKNSNALERFICIARDKEEVPDWCRSFSEFRQFSPLNETVAISPEDPADILYTSGTTGRPKGVVLTHVNKIANGRMFGASTGYYRSRYVCNRSQTPFPFFVSALLGTLSMRWLYYGNTFIFEPAFDVVKSLETMQKEKTTEYSAAPSMLIFMLDHPQFSQYDTTNLRAISYGGSAMPAEVIKRIFKKWPGLHTYDLFGCTEAGPGGTCLHLDANNIKKIGSVGVPWLPDQEVRIIDGDGNDLPAGEVGEFVIKGPNVMKCYHNNPEATEAAFMNGWLLTGDLGYYDEDGFFYYTDRKKDMIVRGGFNVYPVEVESVLHEHPAVLQCAVIGKPHDKLGEDVAALIVLKEGQKLEAKDIYDFCSDKLADYKRPREIQFLSSLPITAMGKLDKKEMRRQFFKSNTNSN